MGSEANWPPCDLASRREREKTVHTPESFPYMQRPSQKFGHATPLARQTRDPAGGRAIPTGMSSRPPTGEIPLHSTWASSDLALLHAPALLHLSTRGPDLQHPPSLTLVWPRRAGASSSVTLFYGACNDYIDGLAALLPIFLAVSCMCGGAARLAAR